MSKLVFLIVTIIVSSLVIIISLYRIIKLIKFIVKNEFWDILDD